MNDLIDPTAGDVREALRIHADDIGTPRTDLASRAEQRAVTLRRRRAAALSGGVALVIAAAVAIPLSLSGSSGAGARIKQQPPAAVSLSPVPVVDTDPTTWPFRGDATIRDALVGAATVQVNLHADRTASYRAQPLYAVKGPYGDRYLAFLGIPTNPGKNIAFAVYQQPASGPGFLLQPYDLGPAGQLTWKMLDLATGTSIPYDIIVAAPDAAGFRIKVQDGTTSSYVSCAKYESAGTALCPGADSASDQIQLLDASGQVVAFDTVHTNNRD